MNTKENKHTLWELSKQFFVSGMRRDQIISLFESTLGEVDESCKGDLVFKNKLFLSKFVNALSHVEIELGEPVIEVIELPTFYSNLESRLTRAETQISHILTLLSTIAPFQTPLPWIFESCDELTETGHPF